MKTPTNLHTCLTYPTGRFVDLLHPRAEDVHPHDIAWHLALTNRFGGMVRGGYPVAQHSVFVHDLVETEIPKDYRDPAEDLGPRHFACDPCIDQRVNALVVATLHDGHEAYLGDLIAPLKSALRDFGVPFGLRSPWDYLERIHDEAIFKAFGAWGPPRELHEAIKKADLLAYQIEAAALRRPGDAGALAKLPGGRVLPPWEAANLFLERLGRYVKGIEPLNRADFLEPPDEPAKVGFGSATISSIARHGRSRAPHVGVGPIPRGSRSPRREEVLAFFGDTQLWVCPRCSRLSTDGASESGYARCGTCGWEPDGASHG